MTSYKIVFTNGNTRTLNSNSVLEAYCDSVLYALVNRYVPVIKEIIDIKENITHTDFILNFNSK